MKGLIVVLFLIINPVANAQNLVPNPGFEDYNFCPQFASQIDLAIPWLTASPGTPDFFHACSSDDQIMVPYAGFHHLSYQPARSGQGMGHLCVYTTINMAVSEYMQTELTTYLEAGTAYYIEFYVSPDLDSSPQTTQDFVGSLGFGFSNSTYFEEIPSGQAISITPAIEHYGPLITDTVGWTRISGCYLAKGGEKNAILGNFRNVEETIVQLENPNIWPHSIYYYFEDILVEAFDPLPDTLLLCDGMTAMFNAAFHDAVYSWNTGQTDSILHIQEEGLYIVEATINGCALRDSVLVLDGSVPSYFPEDTMGCKGSPMTLSTPLPGHYLWSTGSTYPQVNVENPGTYSLTVDNDCGQYEFASSVNFEECSCALIVPNIFSPNGDGINDEIGPSVSCDFEYKLLTFQLFDRWGNNIFNADTDDAIIWTGDVSGKEAQSGVYVWQSSYQVIKDGQIELRQVSGDILLVR